jgi:dihydrofolate synthase/folylpolyglutamate synthase
MASLARTWRRSPWSRGKARWIMGLMRDKDAAGILKPVAPFLREVVTVRPPSPRALDAVTLARAVRRAAPRAHVSVESDPATALRSWLDDRGPSAAVVCGSFYLVGEASRVLRGGRAAA